MKDVTVKVSRKHLEIARNLAKKNRRPIKTTIELAIESAVKEENK